MLDRREDFRFIDVRTPEERQLACIDGAALLDQRSHDEILALDPETPLVFHCHHGIRCQDAAEYFPAAGFRHLPNLLGGIHACSRQAAPVGPLD